MKENHYRVYFDDNRYVALTASSKRAAVRSAIETLKGLDGWFTRGPKPIKVELQDN